MNSSPASGGTADSEPTPPPKMPRTEDAILVLAAAIEKMGQQLGALALKVEAMEQKHSYAPPSPPPPPAYPPNVTPEALQRLSTDPRTPTAIVPFLTTLAALLPTLLDEAH
eukprot:RCo049751